MLRLTRHGIREMMIGSIVLGAIALGLAYVWLPLAVLVLPVWIWLFAFFRDPERPVPTEPRIMVSPADGTVSDVTPLSHVQLLGEPAVRIGIFLSVFDVHINRAPCDGRVTTIKYQPGRFINALHHQQASEQNECNTLVLCDVADGQPLAMVKQIVGAIARRIVCTASVGDLLQRGQRIGMMKFGSRTELFIPTRLNPEVKVAVGQKVRGALDVIAVLHSPAPTTATPTAESACGQPALPKELK
ncbi:MAG: phosphatidylserine decarboxylase [Bacillota bacterium]